MRRQKSLFKFGNYDFLYQRSVESALFRLSLLKDKFHSPLIMGDRLHSLAQKLSIENTISILDTVDEVLPYPPQSFDLVVNILLLHQINDVPGYLAQIKQILKPGGFFIASFFGGESLSELREALTQSELYLSGGVTARMSPLIAANDGANLMRRAGFEIPVVDVDRVTIHYPNLLTLFDDLKGMGERNILAMRSRAPLPLRLLQITDEYYHQHFADPQNQLIASVELVTVTGWRGES